MIRGIEGRNIVDDEQDRADFVRRLGELSTASGTAIYAWALMSNHAHILLSSGASGLAPFMRRLLTGYAVNFNLRHRRYGHLFQNRYKSIVCDGDSYFTELVRYIHLNPLRGSLVTGIKALERYPYCGHAAILGNINYEWQDRHSVLAQFGSGEMQAKRAYRRFVEEGLAFGRRPELVGGGLIRSAGGWAEVRSQRQRREVEPFDERILGSGEFVERVLAQAEARMQRQQGARRLSGRIERVIAGACTKSGVSLTELRSGSRRGRLPTIRAELACKLVEDFGVATAEVARQLGISTSGVSKILTRSLSS
jgi:REP element-mobilizing transposase RayT/CRP-like cAMP-binding protein